MFAICRQWTNRWWSALAIASIAALLLTSTASAAKPIAHRVQAGAPDLCVALGDRIGCDGNYSFSAIQYSDGSVTGQYSDRFARVMVFTASSTASRSSAMRRGSAV